MQELHWWQTRTYSNARRTRVDNWTSQATTGASETEEQDDGKTTTKTPTTLCIFSSCFSFANFIGWFSLTGMQHPSYYPSSSSTRTPACRFFHSPPFLISFSQFLQPFWPSLQSGLHEPFTILSHPWLLNPMIWIYEPYDWIKSVTKQFEST